MIRNYFLTAWRNLWKHKLSSLINLLCLSVGMSCCMLILIFVKDELSYNKFNAKYDSIFRIDWTSNRDGTVARNAITPVPLGPVLKNQIPQIESLARMFQRSGAMEVSAPSARQAEGKRFQEQNVFFSDTSLFSVFTISFLKGDRRTALARPNSVVITDEMARKYFGTEEAMGRFLLYDTKQLLQVTGVVNKMPASSDIQFDFLVHFETVFSVELPDMAEFIKNDWTYNPVYTYCVLRSPETYAAVESQLNAVLKKFGTDRNREMNTLLLQPLSRIHLYASDVNANNSNSNITFIYIFSAVAFLILLIANVNFINLATALANTRSREVGVRKVMGAGRRQLIFQFLSETVLFSLIALCIAFGITHLGLPILNQLTGKQLGTHSWFNAANILLFAALFCLTGIIAGLYPAVFITRFNMVLALKGKSGEIRTRNTLRKVLLVTQFSVSMILIIGATIVYQQLNFLRNKPLGFLKEHVLVVPIFGSGSSSIGYGVDGPMRQRMNTFSGELAKYSKVKAVTAASALPGQWYIPGLVIPEGHTEQSNIFVPWLCVDYNFLATMKIPLLAGRDFSKATGTDHLAAFIINESAVKLFGWKSPKDAIGRNIIRGSQADGKKGQVIGVVKDHNFNRLDQPLQPLIMDVNVARFSFFAINIQSDHVPETVERIRQEWDKHFPERIFEYSFLDKDIDLLYADSENLSRLTGYFALIAILLSCLGLFGLSAFLAVQRTREIGIRKVLGASAAGITVLLSKDFLKLVLIALVVACPIAWAVMHEWLQNYFYRIQISWLVFAAAGLVVALITIFTVGLHSFKAAMLNPVKSLRTE